MTANARSSDSSHLSHGKATNDQALQRRHQPTLGDITDGQLQFLIDQFEEEWGGDQDYYINTATIDMLKDAGADPSLLALLQRALGAAGQSDIRWSSK